MEKLNNLKKQELTFSDEEIAKLFGHEAAEDEKIDRLKEYYFKNELYDQIIADLPLRIVVGHKGIGKSALFQVAQYELNENDILTVSITPDDINQICEDSVDMLQLIRLWKNGLKEIISQKALTQLGDLLIPAKGIGDSIINFAIKFIEGKGNLNISNEKEKLIFKFLENKKIVVFIDDLDRGWEGKRSDIRRVSAMLNAVRDLARENDGINFKVSLRTDVYYLFRTSDESTDKVEGSVVWINWQNFEILALLAKRILTFFGYKVDDYELLNKTQKELSKILDLVFEERFFGSGAWKEIPIYRLLTSLIRKRPRDLIKICTLAAKEARKNKSNKIGTHELNSIFEVYSLGRLQDTIIEFRSELPEIERLLTNMKPTREEKKHKIGHLYTNDRLITKVNNIISTGAFKFSNGKNVSCKELCAFMYKINFLTARKDTDNKIIRKYFEENKFLMSEFTDYGFDWEVHPAYRWALQPDDVFSLFDNIPLYSEE